MIRTVKVFMTLVALLAAVSFSARAEALTPIAQLGKLMYQDKEFSYNGTQSCMTCHHHMSGFADPDNSRDPYSTVVSTGADGVSQGGRNAPTSAYAGYSPILRWDDLKNGYVGGMFWDGRATGRVLGDPLAEQAQGPPLNPVEMNMPDAESVVQAVRDAAYAPLFRQVFGADALDDTARAYNYIAQAIAAYERSAEVQKFTSRFDRGVLSEGEQRGYLLFQSHCAQCHSVDSPIEGVPALFTGYGYENIGVPPNPLLAGRPADLGLGGFLEDDFLKDSPLIGDADYAAQYGKFKVPALRNVQMTAPYGHNGVFPTLRDVVSFHNSRDVADWPQPEVALNLNVTDIGNMGLSSAQVDDVVLFLVTLNDARQMRP